MRETSLDSNEFQGVVVDGERVARDGLPLWSFFLYSADISTLAVARRS